MYRRFVPLASVLIIAALFATPRPQSAKSQAALTHLAHLPMVLSGVAQGPVPPPAPPAPAPPAPAPPAPAPPAPAPPPDNSGQIETSGQLTTALPFESGPQGERSAAVTTPINDGPIKTITCSTQNWGEAEVRSLEDRIALNVNGGIVYPGALVQGKDLEKGIFTPITIPRSGGTIYVEGLKLAPDAEYRRELEEITGSKVKQQIEQILDVEVQGTAARFTEQFEQTYSTQHMLFELGVDARYNSFSLSTDLKIDSQQQRNYVFLKFTQIFYDVIYEDPQLATSVFRDGAAFEDPEDQIGPGNPPLYVQKVSYGRMVFLVAESAYSALDVQAALDAAYNGASGEATVSSGLTHKQIMEKTKMYYSVIGGAADLALAPIVSATPDKRFEAVRNFIADKGAANFSASNPGVPIAYSMRYLSSRAPASMSYSVTYGQKNCTSDVGNYKFEFFFEHVSDGDDATITVNGAEVYDDQNPKGFINVTPHLDENRDNNVEVGLDNDACFGHSMTTKLYKEGAQIERFEQDPGGGECIYYKYLTIRMNPTTGAYTVDYLRE